MGNLNAKGRLVEGGLAAKQGSLMKVWIRDIQFAPLGHALQHPRQGDDPGEDLVQSIVTRGFLDECPIIVAEVTVQDSKKALYVIDGSRRTNAARAAEEILKAQKSLPKDDLRLFVPIVIFNGSEPEALAYRLRANSDPLKKPDAPSVLATTFKQLGAFGWTVAQMAEAHGRIAKSDVEALLRFTTLPDATRAAFDADVLPVSAMGEFLDRIAPEDHAAAIEAAAAAGGSARPRLAKKAAKKAAKVPGSEVEKIRAAGRVVRQRLAEMLVNNSVTKFKGEELKMARCIAGMLRRLDGDPEGMAAWPEIDKIYVNAIAEVQKEKAEKKAKNVVEEPDDEKEAEA